MLYKCCICHRIPIWKKWYKWVHKKNDSKVQYLNDSCKKDSIESTNRALKLDHHTMGTLQFVHYNTNISGKITNSIVVFQLIFFKFNFQHILLVWDVPWSVVGCLGLPLRIWSRCSFHRILKSFMVHTPS